MPTFRWTDLPHEAVDGAHSPVTAPVYRGEKIQAARVVYKAGIEVKRHPDAHEQIHSVLSGRARYAGERDE